MGPDMRFHVSAPHLFFTTVLLCLFHCCPASGIQEPLTYQCNSMSAPPQLNQRRKTTLLYPKAVERIKILQRQMEEKTQGPQKVGCF